MAEPPKIVLIVPPSKCVSDDKVEPPLGLLYLASNLRQNGYMNVSVLDMSGCNSDEQIYKKIENIPEADIYGITCVCTNYYYAKSLVKAIRSNVSDAYIVMGGANPSALPKHTLEDSNVDAVITGEGEDALNLCVNSYVRGEKRCGVIQGSPRFDIDSYAFPARDMINIESYSRRLMGKPVVSLLGSRGCAHRCIHCNSVVMGGGSVRVRYRSSKNILEEIGSLIHEQRCFRFNDDHFTGNPHLEDLLRKFEELDITFRIFARIEDLTEKNCLLLKKAGCIHVSVGIESLNADNLKILGKSSQIGKEENIRIAHSYGLVTRVSFIVGLPYDNDGSIVKYFNRAGKLGFDEYAVYPLIPYPGTKIWDSPGRYGYTIVNTDYNEYIQMGIGGKTCYTLKHESFTPDDVRKWHQKASEILESSGVRHMKKSEIAT